MQWTVQESESGMKLLAFLVKHLEGYSAKYLKRAIENNSCQINSRTERFASSIVGHGDIIDLQVIEKKATKFEPNRILYEDDSLFVYDKPAGVNCDEEGIVKLLKVYNPNLRLAHRLDRDTTGVLLLTKSIQIFENIVEQFKRHEVTKIYYCLVDGVVKKNKGWIDNYLVKERAFAGQTIWGQIDAPSGLHAVTEWECTRKGKEASLVICHPKTGRTHQLRVHMAGMGHPILGDVQYGKKIKSSHRPGRYLLHAEGLELSHPLTQIKLSIHAPLPADFIRSQSELIGK